MTDLYLHNKKYALDLGKFTSLVKYACKIALGYVQSWYHAKK